MPTSTGGRRAGYSSRAVSQRRVVEYGSGLPEAESAHVASIPACSVDRPVRSGRWTTRHLGDEYLTRSRVMGRSGADTSISRSGSVPAHNKASASLLGRQRRVDCLTTTLTRRQTDRRRRIERRRECVAGDDDLTGVMDECTDITCLNVTCIDRQPTAAAAVYC